MTRPYPADHFLHQPDSLLLLRLVILFQDPGLEFVAVMWDYNTRGLEVRRSLKGNICTAPSDKDDLLALIVDYWTHLHRQVERPNTINEVVFNEPIHLWSDGQVTFGRVGDSRADLTREHFRWRTHELSTTPV